MLLAFTVSTTAQNLPKPLNPTVEEWVDSKPIVWPDGQYSTNCQVMFSFGTDFMGNPVADDYPGNEAVFEAMDQGITLDYTTLDPENVFYSIFTDNDKLFVFSSDIYYRDFEEDTYLIPFDYDGFSFLSVPEIHFIGVTTRVDVLAESGIIVDPFFTWRIGVQTYYIVDGETSASDIVYMEIIPQLQEAKNVTSTSFLADWSCDAENTYMINNFIGTDCGYFLYVVNKETQDTVLVQNVEPTDPEKSIPGATYMVEGLTPGTTYQYFVIVKQNTGVTYKSVVREVTLPETVYILGEVNEQSWAPNAGTLMEYDAENNVYTATVNCDGRNDGYNYFSFTTRVAENNDQGGWDYIKPFRFGAVTDGNNFLVTDEQLNKPLSLEMNEEPHAFQIPAGEYKLTVDYANMKLIIEKIVPDHGYDLGDVNHDHAVNIADVTALIDYLLGTGTVCEICADVNGDGPINIADVTALIDILLNNNN